MSDNPKSSNFDKLKDFGSSLVGKTDSLVNKVKSTVNDNEAVSNIFNKVKNTVGLNTAETVAAGTTDEQVQAIGQTLKNLFELQKQQLAVMNALKQQIQLLVKEKTGQTTESEEKEPEDTP